METSNGLLDDFFFSDFPESTNLNAIVKKVCMYDAELDPLLRICVITVQTIGFVEIARADKIYQRCRDTLQDALLTNKTPKTRCSSWIEQYKF